MSVSEVIRVVKNSSINLPVGIVSGKSGEFILKISEKADNVQQLENIFITPSIRLKDIADVRYDYYINRSFYIGNGKSQ
ncbi:MAG: hypothetical protein Q9M89_04605 [Persephonella sp.]|nr:hypothetical protein [Persephonella sp.]